jgi:hypothetical protein
LRYGQRVTDSLTFDEAPFPAVVNPKSFHHYGQRAGPGELALKTCPPAAAGLMLSLLLGYLAWLATANRMSFTWEIDMGIAAREFELFCQPLVNARTQACTAWRSCCAGITPSGLDLPGGVYPSGRRT